MKIIEPKVELWLQDDHIAHVAKCARVCYGNKEGKSTDQQLYDNLLKAKHNSMFRHESVYAIIPRKDNINNRIETALAELYTCPYINYILTIRAIYVVTNGNWIIDNADSLIAKEILKHRVPAKEFENASEVAWNIMRYTFHITTQISTSRELNRVSPNNIVERSSRYCLEDGVIVRPHWLTSQEIIDDVNKFGFATEKTHQVSPTAYGYLNAMLNSFNGYRNAIDCGMKRQDARGVLPLDTATEVVYTYSIDEWKHIIALRSNKRAHPNCQIIANMIKKELEELGYGFD